MCFPHCVAFSHYLRLFCSIKVSIEKRNAMQKNACVNGMWQLSFKLWWKVLIFLQVFCKCNYSETGVLKSNPNDCGLMENWWNADQVVGKKDRDKKQFKINAVTYRYLARMTIKDSALYFFFNLCGMESIQQTLGTHKPSCHIPLMHLLQCNIFFMWKRIFKLKVATSLKVQRISNYSNRLLVCQFSNLKLHFYMCVYLKHLLFDVKKRVAKIILVGLFAL